MTVALERLGVGTPGDRMEHRFLGVDSRSDGGHCAICSCGWSSSPLPSATRAGGAWDEHAAGRSTSPAPPVRQDEDA